MGPLTIALVCALTARYPPPTTAPPRVLSPLSQIPKNLVAPPASAHNITIVAAVMSDWAHGLATRRIWHHGRQRTTKRMLTGTWSPRLTRPTKKMKLMPVVPRPSRIIPNGPRGRYDCSPSFPLMYSSSSSALLPSTHCMARPISFAHPRLFESTLDQSVTRCTSIGAYAISS